MIKIKNKILYLNFEPQLSTLGEPIRLSGIAKNAKVPEKYVNKKYRNHWIYTFRYIGTDKFISFEFDYLDNFVGVVK